jgi:hypothetical protein
MDKVEQEKKYFVLTGEMGHFITSDEHKDTCKDVLMAMFDHCEQSERILEEYPIEPTEIDSYITGATGLYCVDYGSCIETGYYSEKLGYYFAITEYPGGIHAISTWEKPKTE